MESPIPRKTELIMLYAVMNGIPIKQIFKYQINPSTASSGVAMTDTIALTESSNNTVHTIERDINNTAVFPTARFTFSFSFAPAARPIMTVEPIASPTIITVSMCITWLPMETAVVLSTPQYCPMMNKSAMPYKVCKKYESK